MLVDAEWLAGAGQVEGADRAEGGRAVLVLCLQADQVVGEFSLSNLATGHDGLVVGPSSLSEGYIQLLVSSFSCEKSVCVFAIRGMSLFMEEREMHIILLFMLNTNLTVLTCNKRDCWLYKSHLFGDKICFYQDGKCIYNHLLLYSWSAFLIRALFFFLGVSELFTQGTWALYSEAEKVGLNSLTSNTLM